MVTNTKLAFIFPGQGSQKTGMLSELAKQYSSVRETFSEAADVLKYNLWTLSQEGPQSSLNMTECAQPLLLTASVAMWRVWRQENGPYPVLMAGHSLGEWSALVCSEVLTFSDAINLVRLRGKFMQKTVPVGIGSMAAIIGLRSDAVNDACTVAQQGEIVSPVNFNSPEQVVIAGHVGAVKRAIDICTSKGAKRAITLAVSAPFHSSLLRPAADNLAVNMSNIEFNTPVIPIIHNFNAQPEMNPKKIKNLMLKQIYNPVLWNDCISYLLTSGVNQIVECGPGKVLSGLIRSVDRSINTVTIDTPSTLLVALSNQSFF